MQIIYLAGCYSKTVKDWTTNNLKSAFQLPGDKFHNLVAKGLKLNGVEKVHVISQLQVTASQIDQSRISFEDEEEDGVFYHYLVYTRKPIIKNILAKRQLNRLLEKLINGNHDSVIICDVLNLTFSQGALRAAEKFNICCFGVVTDLPFYVQNPKSAISKISAHFSEKLMAKFKGNIILTEGMKDDIYVRKTPTLVVEGMVDYSLVKSLEGSAPVLDSKMCLYAGGIYKEYGVDVLVEAFKKMEDKTIKLCIYGNGSYVDELKQDIKNEPNIEYRGVVSNDEIIVAEKQSELLINPRPCAPFTKYSFPSKNMEYMASGVPMLGVKLPGIPKEYYDYMLLADECDSKAFKAIIENHFKKPRDERRRLGLNAREFVLENKNNKKQCERIIAFILGIKNAI